MGRYLSNGGEVADTTWTDACSGNEWYRVFPLTDRTKTEDRMESRILVGFRMKSSEYMLTVSGEAILASTIGR